jgi:hypothetical protein
MLNRWLQSVATLCVLILISVPTFAQTPKKDNSDDIDEFVKNHNKQTDRARIDRSIQKSGPDITPCKSLRLLSILIDRTFDGQKEETRITAPMLRESDDSIWDTLIDCSEATKQPSERAESLRVAAVWERLRADTFRKMYLEQLTVGGSARPPATSPKLPVSSSRQSVPVTADKPTAINDPILKAIKDGDVTVERDRREGELRAGIADPSALVTIAVSEHTSDEVFKRVSVHNRALCDQVIVVTRLTPAGLTLEYGSPEGLKFLRKNYPRVCLLEDTTHFAPGVPRYLLVYANSQNDFSGFQAVRRTTETPIYGSGTVTNAYGNTWNFTYSGTEETTSTVQTSYTVNSQSIFLNAYDEKGNIVSQHSFTTSSQTGGDAAYAAGYNAGNLVSRLWSNPERLAASVLKDVQKDSMKYAKH